MAASLFAWMKKKRMNVEYAPEFAKDVVWEKSHDTLDDQIYLFGEQHHRLYRLLDQVDYIVTDSPLLVSLYYYRNGLKKYYGSTACNSFHKLADAFESLVIETIEMYDNINFEVVRGNRAFIQSGRLQNEEQSKEIDNELRKILRFNDIPFKTISTLEEVLMHLGFQYDHTTVLSVHRE